MKKHFLIIVLAVIGQPSIAQSAFDKMTNLKMEKILIREAEKFEGENGNWQIIYKERQVLIITDENANRMRIMTPITEESEISQEIMKLMLEANFDRALDSKYSIFKGVVWSVYTHPLAELTVEQLKDALKQVVALAENFGSTYTSTDMIFGGGQ